MLLINGNSNRPFIFFSIIELYLFLLFRQIIALEFHFYMIYRNQICKRLYNYIGSRNPTVALKENVKIIGMELVHAIFSLLYFNCIFQYKY